MSYIEAFQPSPSGMPAQFVAAKAELNTVLTALINPPGAGATWVLLGVDASATITAVSFDAWITVNPGGGKMAFASNIVAEDPTGYFPASWRGFLPFAQPQTVEVGIECLTPADLALLAWGIWLPTPLEVHT